MSWVESQPQYYLERAALARIEAQTTGDAEMRDELLRIAISFELLAVHKKHKTIGADPI